MGFFRGPEEAKNFSMDRYAKQLKEALVAFGGFTVREVRLSRSWASGLADVPVAGSIYRHWRQGPRYLVHARATSFSVNHVLDHAYGHLVYAPRSRSGQSSLATMSFPSSAGADSCLASPDAVIGR